MTRSLFKHTHCLAFAALFALTGCNAPAEGADKKVAPSAVKGTPVSTPKPASTPASTPVPVASPEVPVQSAFELKLYADLSEPHGELTMLPSLDPVDLVAEIDQVAVVPPDLTEVRRRVVWTASAGEVIAYVDTPTTSARAQYYPPSVSVHAVIQAELTVFFERPTSSGGVRTIEHSSKATLQILTPIASAGNLIDGMIDGYKIGEYLHPDDPHVAEHYALESDWYMKYPKRYHTPDFFYKVETDSKPLSIGPNTYLDTWVIDFPWKSFGLPQYVALDVNLLKKLEDLITIMREDGHKVTRFIPIYGFRPPWFNLGTIESNPDTNLKVPFSMHQYGRAVDFIIDEDGDGVMDDLNGDGKHDIHDAAVIMHYVNILDRKYREEKNMDMVGGAGLYPNHDFVQRPAQTPYIHVDTRGFTRDDKSLIRWPTCWPIQDAHGKWMAGSDPIRWGKI